MVLVLSRSSRFFCSFVRHILKNFFFNLFLRFMAYTIIHE